MMEGVNAAGKRVSLLCDDDAPAMNGRSAKAQQLPQPAHPLPRPRLPLHSRLPSVTGSATAAHHRTAAAAPTRPGPCPIVASSASASSRSSISTLSIYHSDSDSSLSRNSSIASPSLASSRAVPPLSRHDSCSSAQSVNTPSPMTPTYFDSGEPLDPKSSQPINNYGFTSIPTQHALSNPAAAGLVAGTMAAASNAAYYPSGPLPVTASQTNVFGGYPNAALAPVAFEDPYAVPQVQYQYATDLIAPQSIPTAVGGLSTASLASPTSLASAPIPPVDPSSIPANGSTAPNTTLKAKKKYPCPHAAKFNCQDTFTTSGHAARHGKKHTGEKNILCPTCHKAFTRKDNMKQHERTHKNRVNNGSDNADHAKSGHATGHSRRTQSISSVAASTVTHKSSDSVSMELDSPVADVFDSKRSSMQRPSLARPGQYSGSNSTGSGEFKLEPLQPPRPGLQRNFSGESQDGEGESPGLDALAMAASAL